MSCAEQEEIVNLQKRVQHLIQIAPPLQNSKLSCASTKPSIGIQWELH